MARIHFDLFAARIFERLRLVEAFVEMLEQALPLVEKRERDELRELASRGEWPPEEYAVESEILDERFGHCFRGYRLTRS